MTELVVDTDDWSIISFKDRDGCFYKVVGECETEKCNAVCCRVANWQGIMGQGPCSYLTEDNKCSTHKERGFGTKFLSCWVWPKRQIDIDTVNAAAEKYGMEHRCHLKVVKVE